MSRIPSNSDKARELRAKETLVVGEKINKLTLKERRQLENKRNQWEWICDCDCGTKDVHVLEYRLKNEKLGIDDNVGSCGCIRREKTNLGNKGNNKGTVETRYKYFTAGGCPIVAETPYRDNNRSKVIMAECPQCGRIFPTVSRSRGESCGCLSGRTPNKLEDYILKRNFKSINEREIGKLLDKHAFPFEPHKTFSDLIDEAFLPFDFFVDNKYVLEYDGEQHFKQISFYDYEYTHKHDLMKNEYCFTHNIPIIRIPYDTEYTVDDLVLETTRFLLTPENEKEYYESRKK